MLLAICTLVSWAGVTGKHTFDSAPEGSRWGRRAGEQNGENRANGGRWQGAPTERALILFIKGPQLEHLKLVIWLRGLRPSPPRRPPSAAPPAAGGTFGGMVFLCNGVICGLARLGTLRRVAAELGQQVFVDASVENVRGTISASGHMRARPPGN